MQVAHMEKSLELSKKTAAVCYGLSFFRAWILPPHSWRQDDNGHVATTSARLSPC